TQDSLEFRRRVWQEQLVTYRRLAEAIGAVSASTAGAPSQMTSVDRVRFDSASRSFEALYWSTTVFVSDSSLEQRLRQFHDALRDARLGRDGAADRLRERGDETLKLTREILQRGWNSLGQ